jgi:ATP-dependent DNA helicase RecQ
VPDFDPAAIPLEAEARRRAYEYSRLEMMRGYAECPACRRRYLLNYFGEEYEAERCGRCDNDLAAPAEAAGAPAAAEADGPFAVNDRVVHAAWGAGVVHRVAGDTLTVLFDEVGYKTLRSDIVLEQGLLQRA